MSKMKISLKAGSKSPAIELKAPDTKPDVVVPKDENVPAAPSTKDVDQKSAAGSAAPVQLPATASATHTGKEQYIELPIIKNPETKSEFMVVGLLSDGLRLSMRFWKEASDPGFTCIGFRMRIGDLLPDYAPLPGTVYQHIVETYPAVIPAVSNSSKASAVHVSIENTVLIPEDPWEQNRVVKAFLESGFAEELHAKLNDVLMGVQLIDLNMFKVFMAQQIKRQIADVYMPGWAKMNKQVLWRVGLTQTPLMFKAPEAPQQDPSIMKEPSKSGGKEPKVA